MKIWSSARIAQSASLHYHPGCKRLKSSCWARQWISSGANRSFHDEILSPIYQKQLFIQNDGFPTVFLAVIISAEKEGYGLMGTAEQLKQFQSLCSRQDFHPSAHPHLNSSSLVGSQWGGINRGEITWMPERLIYSDYFLAYRQSSIS